MAEHPETTEGDTGDDAIIGRAFRWSLVVLAGLGVIAGGTALGVWWLKKDATAKPVSSEPVAAPEVETQKKVNIPTVRFTDVTKEAGIGFVHENGAYGKKLLPETMGSGCAFFDFDSDGDQDILFVNSTYWPWREHEKADPTMALYENDGTGHFKNVTEGSGLGVSLYGQGVSVGDVDNDGDPDVFVTAVGKNRLFENRGDGRFREITEEAGVGGDPDGWSTSAAFFDSDDDGDLDLFVCNYVKWSKKIDLSQNFELVGVGRAYGPPKAFEGTFPYMYRNDSEDGEVRFTDVSKETGVRVRNDATGVPVAKALGVMPVDVERDGDLDLIVANDTVRNFLFRNRGDGTFEEVGQQAGVAYGSNGQARGAMGIDAARFSSGEQLRIAIGNFSNEMTALYARPNDDVPFTDVAIPAGVGAPTRLDLTFGLFYFDYDLDGRLDLFSANGHLEQEIHQVQKSQHYRQPARLFWNAGSDHSRQFVDVPKAKCGPDLKQPLVGRGAAYADIDGDGDLDILVTQVDGPPLLLRNDQELGHHFIRLKLVGKRCNRDAVGARVAVETEERTRWRTRMPAGSYLSRMELPVTVGLDKRSSVEQITVHWPDGSVQRVSDYRLDATTRVVQQSGSGKPEAN